MQGGAELGQGQSTPHSPALHWAARRACEFGTLLGGCNKGGVVCLAGACVWEWSKSDLLKSCWICVEQGQGLSRLVQPLVRG